ncbi:MAG: tRNA (guanosine(46)-N7)-methyltransferase TrmB [Treponema sp. CETP13]|nr:MAG: tRNA (guanosine(46)-N7)-methyltransferase TrmB [Treponema sp. CETP13]
MDSKPPLEDSFYRKVQTFVLRKGRMTEGQQRDYETLSGSWCLPFNNLPLNYNSVFDNTNEVTIEIGFGMGHATADLAEKNPDKNYLGLEVHTPGVGRLLGEIRKRQLHNLFIIEHDALEVLQVMIPDNSVQAFHIFFPDPWPKKKHHKRRLMQRNNIDLIVKKLAPGGYLYFVTDWLEYAESTLELLENTANLKNKYQGFAEKQSWRPQTKFERKGLEAERPITELMFIKPLQD